MNLQLQKASHVPMRAVCSILKHKWGVKKQWLLIVA